MVIYPHNSAIILDDSDFVFYGGQTGTTTQAQRNAMYLIAEKKVSQYVGTLLLPTIVTGLYHYNPYAEEQTLSTDYGYVHSIQSVKVRDVYGDLLYTVSSTGTTRYYRISDDTYGYIMVRDVLDWCSSCSSDKPYDVEVVYTAGLPTGTASQPDMLMALAIVAQINLNEIIFPAANESTGDIGITEFSTLEYSEKRKPFKNTVLGRSAKAAKAAELIDGAIKKARKAIRFP